MTRNDTCWLVSVPKTVAQGDEIAQQPEFSRRLRAARGYASLTQPELAGLLQLSTSYLRQVEGGKQLKPVQARGLIERVAEVCELPKAFFTADFAQLDPHYQPPEDQLATLEITVRELMAQLADLSEQATVQLREGSERLDQVERVVQAVDTQAIKETLARIEQATPVKPDADAIEGALSRLEERVVALAATRPELQPHSPDTSETADKSQEAPQVPARGTEEIA
jgi:transcriptional regulator with XRE-family HTH domain